MRWEWMCLTCSWSEICRCNNNTSSSSMFKKKKSNPQWKKNSPQIIKEGDANSTASVFSGLSDSLSCVVWPSNTKRCRTATKIHELQQLNEERKHENYKHLKKLKLQLWNHPQCPFLYFRMDPKKRELLLSSCFLLEQDERKKKKSCWHFPAEVISTYCFLRVPAARLQ